MLIHLIHFVTMWLNNFPTINGISPDYSSREIILCHRLSYKRHCRAPFGAYCETHEDNLPTNSMHSRALPTICLGPTGNFQGSYWPTCLPTFKVAFPPFFATIPQIVGNSFGSVLPSEASSLTFSCVIFNFDSPDSPLNKKVSEWRGRRTV